MCKDIPPYHILGACSPKLADRVISEEPNAGTLLPCNIVIREDISGKVVVSVMDPVAVLGLTSGPEAQAVGVEAKEKLERAVAALT